jgi:hypothetical protein
MKHILIEKINQSDWWHVPPSDRNAYKKRGKFLASTYLQAEFYGRPNMDSERVNIKNPVFGFSEVAILEQLFEKEELEASLMLHAEIVSADLKMYEKRIALDAKMHTKAKQLGYDSIILMTEAGKVALSRARKPNSIELNLVK